MLTRRRLRGRHPARRANDRAHARARARPLRSSVPPASSSPRSSISKRRPSGGWFVIIDAGMTDLLRPALYGAWHAIEPVRPRPGQPWRVDVVGPVCETSDTLGANRELPPVEVGDLLAMRDAGAYGAVMASNYNRRPMAAEVLVDGIGVGGRPPPPDRRRHAAVGRMMLIAFEGLDQSGKETQARHLRARLEQDGRKVQPAVVSRLRHAHRPGNREGPRTASASSVPT